MRTSVRINQRNEIRTIELIISWKKVVLIKLWNGQDARSTQIVTNLKMVRLLLVRQFLLAALLVLRRRLWCGCKQDQKTRIRFR